jgi:hypothetical protein
VDFFRPKLAFTVFVFTLLTGGQTDAIARQKVWTLSKHLEIAGQPELDSLSKIKCESYRFIFRDPGCTSSEIVLIIKDSSKILLKAGEVHLHEYYYNNGKAGFSTFEKALSEDEWRNIMEKLSKLDFWHYESPPTSGIIQETPKPGSDTMKAIQGSTVWVRVQADGTYWTLEGTKNGIARHFEEGSPEEGDYREVCLYLWRLSGLFMGLYNDMQR